MQLTDDQRTEWKNSILGFAREYIIDNLAGALLSQKDVYTKTPLEDSALKRMSNEELQYMVANPFEDARFDKLIDSILDDVLRDFEPAKEGDIGEIVFIAGTLGGRALMAEGENFTDLQNRIAHFESNPVVFTAPMVKQAMAESADFPEYNIWEGDQQDDFALVRPLFSGIDQAIRKHAPELGFNVVIDNTLAMTPQATQDFIRLIKENNAKGIETRIFSVLLTPEQVEELNGASTIEEAREKTKLFADSIFELQEHVEELQIMNKDGRVLLYSKGGRVQECVAPDTLNAVLKECGYEPKIKIGHRGGFSIAGDSKPRDDQGTDDSGGE